VARGLRPLALLEASCQGASEDFVPPAAQRRLVSRTGGNLARASLLRRRLRMQQARFQNSLQFLRQRNQCNIGPFHRVFEHIFVSPCESAGYHALRADEVRETN